MPSQETVLNERRATTQPVGELEVPGLEQALGNVIDLNRSKGMSRWLEKLPGERLELAGHKIISAVEQLFDEHFSGGIGSFIHIGRNRLELVSHEEATLFRGERELLESTPFISKERAPLRPGLEDVVLLGGPSSEELTAKVADTLGIPVNAVHFSQFPSSESNVSLLDTVRGKRAFFIQSINDPVNDSVMETALAVDALKRASAEEINVIVPLYGYSRQDRKGDARAPVSAQLFAKLLSSAGADRVVTVDVHSAQTEGFFDGPLDNLFASPIIISHLLEKYGDDDLVIVGADEGQFKRLIPITPEIAEALGPEKGKNLAVAAMSKIRTRPGQVDSIRFVGNPADVAGRTAVLWDDMGDTLGTIEKGAELLHELGAEKVVVVLTHLIGSFNGIEKLRNARTVGSDGQAKQLVSELICTDSLPLRRGKGDLITVLPIEGLLAEAINRISSHEGGSLRELRRYKGYVASQQREAASAQERQTERSLH